MITPNPKPENLFKSCI